MQICGVWHCGCLTWQFDRQNERESVNRVFSYSDNSCSTVINTRHVSCLSL